MSIATFEETTNGHISHTLPEVAFPVSRQASWPDDKPLPEDADSHLLIVRVDGLPEFQPDSPYSCLPGALPPMTREAAEMIASKLNRDLIEEAQNRRIWWVVVYNGKQKTGFNVVRIPAPRYKIWRPESEYDLPPGIVGPEINCNVRKNRTDFNRQQLHRRDEWGIKLIEWALHIKPIRKPVTYAGTSSLTSQESVPERKPIPPAGHKIIQAIKDSLRFAEVTSNIHGATLVKCPIVLIDQASRNESSENYIGKHTDQIRNMASQLLDIANQLDGVQEPPLSLIEPAFTEVVISGHDEVLFHVSNCRDEQEAFQKVRQVLCLKGDS